MPELIDCKTIIKYANIDDGCKLDTPDFEDGIELNGRDEYGHETFHFPHNEGDNWCKTDRKPYDLIVCATLLRAKHLAPNAVKISSDGDWDDWSEAVATVNSLWPVGFSV
ncbi:hypothetical protein F5883DRAFT_526574 [Diaporthe sp. PMI_573]|nr:hypothetical protein F5883DRAFT_526574 [Diaporthaceae sp. PMI_573]